MVIDTATGATQVDPWGHAIQQVYANLRGRRVRSDGTFADGRHRKLHVDPCPEWGRRARLGDEVWEEPILAQLEGIELDEATISAVVASLGSGPRPVTLDNAQIERQIRDLALEHAAGRLEDAVYLERLHDLRDAKENLERTSADGISAERAVAWLRELSETWGGRRGSRREGRPAPRRLRAHRDRGSRDRRGSPHVGGLRPRTRACAARKGCTGAPDSV
jgi:hypothetical protein